MCTPRARASAGRSVIEGERARARARERERGGGTSHVHLHAIFSNLYYKLYEGQFGTQYRGSAPRKSPSTARYCVGVQLEPLRHGLVLQLVLHEL
jgi:hypothetical protein